MRKLQTIIFLFALLIFGKSVFAQTADIYQKAADGYLNDRNYQAAFDSYTQAIKKNGHNKTLLPVLYYKRGVSLTGLGKPDEAIKDFNNAIAINPQFGVAYWDRGVAYDNKKNYQQGIADFKKAISLITDKGEDSRLAVLYCNIAFDQWILGNLSGALQSDSISISLNGQYSRAYRLKGSIHFAQKYFDLATDDFTQAIFNYRAGNNLELSGLYTLRADAKREAKKYKDALNDYSLAIGMNPANRLAYWNRAATYHLNSDYELAADDYSKAITFYENDNINLSRLYDDRAVNELGQSLNTKAIEDDSVAISLDTTNRNAYFNLANAYTQNADYQSGINVLNKLVTFFPHQNKLLAVLYYEIANNEYFLNEFDKVVADCSKAIDLNPDYASPYYYRGKVYLKKMNNKQSAMNDFNKVIALDTSKQSVDYIFSLFYIGKGDEAANMLQSNLLNTTDNAVMLSDYYNLACLYSLMNKPDEANIYLKKAIDNGYAKKYVIADGDLDNIRNTDDYKSTMAGTSSQ